MSTVWDEISEPTGSAGVDPRLLQAMDKPTHPKERAALEAEFQDQSTHGYAGVRYGGKPSSYDDISSVVKTTETKKEDSWDAISEPVVEPKYPGVLKHAAQVATSLGGNLLDTAANLAAAVHDPIASILPEGATNPGDSDRLRQFGSDVSSKANKLIASPEELDKGSFWQKVGGNVLGTLPALGLGAAAVPAMAATGTFTAGKQAIDAGEDVSTAQGIGTVQGIANAVNIAPLRAASFSSGIKTAVLGGPPVGAAADFVSNYLAKDEQLKKMYNWADPVNRTSELLTGVAGATAAHISRSPEAKMRSTIDNLHKTDTPTATQLFVDTHKHLEALFKVDEKPFRLPDETPDAALNRILTIRDEEAQARILSGDVNYKDTPEISAAQTLEVLYETAPTDRSRAMVKNMLDQAIDMGLDQTHIFAVTDSKVVGLPRAQGWYMNDPDAAIIDMGKLNRGTNGHAVLTHEIQHALHMRRELVMEQIAGKQQSGEKLSNAEQAFVDKGAYTAWTKQNDYREFLKNKVRGMGEVVESKKWYGLTDNKEFAAELFSPELLGFHDSLRSIKMSKEEMDFWNPKLNMEITNKHHELANAVRGSSTPRHGDALDLAIDHYFNTQGITSMVLRSNRNTFENGKVATQRDSIKEKQHKVDTLRKEIQDFAQSDPKAKYLFNKLYVAVHNAESFGEFKEKALHSSDSPLWHKMIEELGQKIYDRSQFYADSLREASGYYKLSKEEKLLVSDPRIPYEFLRDEAESAKLKDEDISSLGINFHNPSVIRRLKDSGFGGRAILYLQDKGDQLKSSRDKIYYKFKEHTKEYDSLSDKDRNKTFAIGSFFDSSVGRNTLLQNNLQWPTEAMLRARGMEDVHISAYTKLTKGLDYLYEIENQTHRKTHKTDIERIPGFMPHYHDGAYKVFVTKEFKDASGAKYTRRVELLSFNNAYAARAVAREKIKAGFGVEQGVKGELFKVTKYHETGNSLSNSLKEHNEAFFNMQKLGAGGAEALQAADNAVMQGFHKHSMERSGLAGYLGEKGAAPNQYASMKEKVMYHFFNKSKAADVYDRYGKDVAEGWKNAMYMNDYFAPITSIDLGYMNGQLWRGDLFQNFPNAHKYLTKQGRNYIGQNINHFAPVDNALRDISVKLGVDPNLYRNMVRTTRNFLSLVKLRVNPGNYWNNAVQMSHAMAWMTYTDSMTGYKGNPAVAYAKVLKQAYKPDDDMKDAIQYAKENHILDPQLEAELRSRQQTKLSKAVHTVTAGDINPAIEGFGRLATFMVAFEHYKTKYKGDVVRAREAAALAVAPVMVNYDHASRPLMYQDFGVIGEMISPFAVFRNAYVGNTYLMLQAIKRNPKNVHMYAPFIMSQMTFLMTAGILGMVGAGEYNMFADTVNDHFPAAEVPRMEDVMMLTGTPDWMAYGAASALTRYIPGLEEGAYVGPAGAAIGVDDLASSAMIPFVSAIASLAGISTQAVISLFSDSPPPSMKDVYKSTKQLLPGMLQGHADAMFQPEDSDVVFSSTSLDGLIERTKAGRNSIDFVGRLSIDEAKSRQREQSVSRTEAGIKRQVASMVQSGADIATGLPSTWTMDDLLQRATGKFGLQDQEFKQLIVDEINDRRTTKRYKDALAATQGSVSAKRRLNRREELEGNK